MTYDETLVIMGVLKTAYPGYYRDMKRSAAEKTVALWADLLAPYPATICIPAVTRLISESKYPPAISEVIERVKEIINPEGDGSIEAWDILAKAAAGAVSTREQFDKLPYEVKRFCGSLTGLESLGRIDEDIFGTVTRGQFLKSYAGMKRSRETLETVPPEVLALAKSFAKPVNPPAIPKRLQEAAPEPTQENAELPPVPIPFEKIEKSEYARLTDEEWNTRRNELIAKLNAAGNAG